MARLEPHPATRERRDWKLWRRWTSATTLGETAGFCAPAVARLVRRVGPQRNALSPV